jgi:hypothetical protein
VSVAYVAFSAGPPRRARGRAGGRRRHCRPSPATRAGGPPPVGHLPLHCSWCGSVGRPRPRLAGLRGSALGRHHLHPLERPCARPALVWRTLGSSVGATLATAPITALALGTVAPVGILINFAAIPLAAVAVPGVLQACWSCPSPRPSPARSRRCGACTCWSSRRSPVRRAVGPRPAGAGRHRRRGSLPAGLRGALWAVGSGNTLAETGRRAWMTTAVLWVGLARAAPWFSADGGPASRYIFSTSGRAMPPRSAHREDTGSWWTGAGGRPGRCRPPGGGTVSGAGWSPLADRGHRLPRPCRSPGWRALGFRRVPATIVVDPAPRSRMAPISPSWASSPRPAPRGTGRRGDCFVLDGVAFTILHPSRAGTAGVRT